MFLFLSKLLPLFLYPLGLSTLLLGVAIATFWKYPRLASIAVGLALGILLFCGNAWFAAALVRSLESQYPSAVSYPKSSAIVILGGGIRSPVAPRRWPEVNEAGDRVLYGAKLYREGYAPRVILSGGRITWKDRTGDSEAQDIATLLTFMGIPPSALLLENTSLNTHENAVNVKKILADAQIQGDLLLVTSALHMPRAMAIFKKEGMKAIAAPTDYLVETISPAGGLQDFILKLLPNPEMLDYTTRALKEYLGLLIYRLKGWA